MALWWSWGGWRFLMSEVPLYTKPLPAEKDTFARRFSAPQHQLVVETATVRRLDWYKLLDAPVLTLGVTDRSRRESNENAHASETHPSSGDGVKVEPKQVLGSYVCPTVGRVRLHGYHAHKKPPRPLGPP